MSIIPREVDEYFLLDTVMLFLMINYNMPLATIYAVMVIIGTIMYYVATDKGYFHPIPFNKTRSDIPKKIFIGILFGIGFIWIYSIMTTATNGLFAATALGDSKFLGMIVFGGFVALTETRFFFRTTMQWVAWKLKMDIKHPFSFAGIFLIILFAAVFTIFHVTSKGIGNSAEMMATFAFGAVSMGMILHFQEMIQAVIMHIVVNSKGVGLIDYIIDGVTSGALLSNMWFMGAVAVVGFYLYKKGVFKKIIPRLG